MFKPKAYELLSGKVLLWDMTIGLRWVVCLAQFEKRFVLRGRFFFTENTFFNYWHSIFMIIKKGGNEITKSEMFLESNKTAK